MRIYLVKQYRTNFMFTSYDDIPDISNAIIQYLLIAALEYNTKM